MKTNRPIDLIQALVDCTAEVKIAGKALERPDFDPFVDGVNFANALDAMKRASSQLLLSGQMAGFEKIAEIPDVLKSLTLNERSPQASEVFWDQLSKAYPIRSDWAYRTDVLSDALELRILVQMISQHPEPEKVARMELDRLPPHLFMNALTLSLKHMLPPEREFRIEIAELLIRLKNAVVKNGMAKDAAQHIAKHQDLYFPFFKRVLQASLIPDTLKAEKIDPVDAIVKKMLEDLGISQDGLKDIFEKSQLGNSIQVSGFTRLKKMIALPAELLAELYKITGHPLTQEIGEVAIDHPAGVAPYTLLEQMGVVRSPDWHREMQEKTAIGSAIKLYEYAIMTPGIDLSIQRVKNEPLRKSDGVIQELIALVERIPTADADAFVKGQALFDALVFNASSAKSDPMLKELLISSKIDYQFFRSHPALKGPKLEEALGL